MYCPKIPCSNRGERQSDFEKMIFILFLSGIVFTCFLTGPKLLGFQQLSKSSLSSDSAASKVRSLADAYACEYSAAFPEQVVAFGLPGAANDRLSDNSLDGVHAWQLKEDTWSEDLKAIDGGSLWGRPEWLVHGYLKELLEASQGLRIARRELWPISQMTGWQVTFPQLAAIQPVGTPCLRAQALARWRSFPRYLNNEVNNLKEGIRLGYTVPKRVVEIVINQLEALLAMPPAGSPFFSPAQRDGNPEFLAAWEALLTREINPAIRSYCDFLKMQYLARARESIGISSFPNGMECYRALYRYYTSLDRSPQETFHLGERAVTQNEAEAAEIGYRLFGTRDLSVIRDRMTTNPGDHFDSREDLLAFSKEALNRARKTLPAWFQTIPASEILIAPVPSHREQSAFSSYEPGSWDGKRPGTYWINLFHPERQVRSSVEITAFHEAFPGHHLQLALALERPGAHFITLMPVCTSYIEGWARYSEALAEEMGLYTSELSLIRRRLWPAHGMVVDPGIHVMGWSREQAIDYIFSSGCFSRDVAESLVDRIIAFPAQLTAYDTGALEIFSLIDKVRRMQGKQFNIRLFHDHILKFGSVTLPMIREIIDHWLDERGSD